MEPRFIQGFHHGEKEGISTTDVRRAEHDAGSDADELFPEIGECLIFHPHDKTFFVPLPGKRRIDITHTPRNRDMVRLMGEDYMKGFTEITRTAALGTPKKPRVGHHTEADDIDFVSPERVSSEKTSKECLDLGAASVSSVSIFSTDSKIYGEVYQKSKAIDGVKVKRRKTKLRSEDADCDVHFPIVDHNTGFLPVRQSERRIRKQLLSEIPVDDDLGIGLDDNENQRRFWHRQRAKPKEIKSHRFMGQKVVFLVQQIAGNCEWIEEAMVEESLRTMYKESLKVRGENFEASVRPVPRETESWETSWLQFCQTCEDSPP